MISSCTFLSKVTDRIYRSQEIEATPATDETDPDKVVEMYSTKVDGANTTNESEGREDLIESKVDTKTVLTNEPIDSTKTLELAGEPSPDSESTQPDPFTPDDSLNEEMIEQDSKDVPARTVTIEIDRVEDADFYEVHVRPKRQKWSEDYREVFSTDQQRISFRLSPGHYTVRTRSLNKIKVPGPWSREIEFWVRFKSIKDAFPADGQEIIPMGNKTESLTFEWPEIASAQTYFFILRDEKGEILQSLETSKTWLKAHLKTNASYSWMAFPMSKKGEFKTVEELEEVSKEYKTFKILTPPEEGRPILFSVDNIPNAEVYEFEIVRSLTDNRRSEPSFFKSRDGEKQVRLTPGVYEMRARGVYADKNKGDWSQPEKFVVQLNPPDPIGPSDDNVVETFDDEKSPITFTWTRAKEAERFRLTVYDKDGQIVHTEVTSESQLTIQLAELTEYHWIVEAYTPGEEVREPPKKPRVSHVFKTAKYKKLSLAASEEPSQLYGWIKHDSSLVNYQGINRDLNAVVNQRIYGGTGELALGYWHRKSDFGLLTHGALSGFTIVGKTSTYMNYGIHLGHRFKINATTRLRVWAGFTYYEFSEIRTTPFTNFVSFEKIKTNGPQLQVSYLKDVTDILGWHVSGQVYHPTANQGSPNGLPVNHETSYSVSLWGTYRFTDYKGMVGYTYKIEQLSYLSDDPNGGDNRIELSGHFLSFRLEFGLQEPYK
jgi:hypothetical protein